MRCLALFMVPLAVISLPAHAATHLVKPDGTGDYPTIQAAIDAAADGDSIELANGTFAGSGNRDIHVYPMALTIRSQSGLADSCIIDCGGNFAFWFQTGIGHDTIVENLTVTCGNSEGGAMRCGSSSPWIRGCVFRLNTGCTIRSGGDSLLVEKCTFDDNEGDFEYEIA
ncbi:MAG: right-handed parallel beta-helix repeat-containing protein, partial [Actinobacteria bacterium]|nr:right-handed parallel beta-helix repeat-containing protein [Actinomycetota bacterium]